MDMSRVARALIEIAPINFAIHMSLVLVSLFISILIAIPLGILLSRNREGITSNIALQALNTLQTIPAFAFIAISIPLLGFGYLPTIVVLVFQAVLPIVKGTMLGMMEVDSKTREAAKGLGMTDMEVLKELEIPLSTPYILSGIKTSSTYVVSISTLAGFIGAGGLGVLISSGIAMLYPEYLLVGAFLCGVIALGMNFIIEKVESRLMVRIFGSSD